MKSRQNVNFSTTEMIEMYHLGFRIQPAVPASISGQNMLSTCRLELFGRHNGLGKKDDRPCSECIHVLESLFDLSDRIRPIEREIFEKAGDAFNTHAHYAWAAGHEVRLGFEITFQHPTNAGAAGWPWIFLQRVRAMLTGMGCRNCAPADLMCGRHSLETSEHERDKRKPANAA